MRTSITQTTKDNKSSNNISRFPIKQKKSLFQLGRISPSEFRDNFIGPRDNRVNEFYNKKANSFNSYKLLDSDVFKHQTFHYL